MTTDRCIHRIAHNTAQELPTSFQPCLSVRSTRSPSLFSITLTGPAVRLVSLACPQLTLLPPYSSSLHRAPSPSKRLPPRRGENERAHMYARIIRAAAPRSLIVHRNRNCVPASHACGLPVLCPARPIHLLFVAELSTLPSAVIPNDPPIVGLPSVMRGFPGPDRQIARLSLSRRPLVIDLSARLGTSAYVPRCPFIFRPLKALT